MKYLKSFNTDRDEQEYIRKMDHILLSYDRENKEVQITDKSEADDRIKVTFFFKTLNPSGDSYVPFSLWSMSGEEGIENYMLSVKDELYGGYFTEYVDYVQVDGGMPIDIRSYLILAEYIYEQPLVFEEKGIYCPDILYCVRNGSDICDWLHTVTFVLKDKDPDGNKLDYIPEDLFDLTYDKWIHDMFTRVVRVQDACGIRVEGPCSVIKENGLKNIVWGRENIRPQGNPTMYLEDVWIDLPETVVSTVCPPSDVIYDSSDCGYPHIACRMPAPLENMPLGFDYYPYEEYAETYQEQEYFSDILENTPYYNYFKY